MTTSSNTVLAWVEKRARLVEARARRAREGRVKIKRGMR